MINKDWMKIFNSLNSWVKSIVWGMEWFKQIDKCDFLEYEHLWPDLIYISDKERYWIEHFYVDSSEIKKGSKLKSEYNINIKKNIIPNIDKELKEKDISSKSYKFESRLEYENLKNNTYTNFENHYKNISKYIENIKQKFWDEKNIEIIFYIEYNILQSAYLESWKFIRNFYPFNDINFLDFFIKK